MSTTRISIVGRPSKRSGLRSAFALIELPVVVLLLILAGLLVAFIFSFFTGPAPWYAWVIAGLTLPAITALIGVVTFALSTWTSSSEIREPIDLQKRDFSVKP